MRVVCVRIYVGGLGCSQEACVCASNMFSIGDLHVQEKAVWVWCLFCFSCGCPAGKSVCIFRNLSWYHAYCNSDFIQCVVCAF